MEGQIESRTKMLAQPMKTMDELVARNALLGERAGVALVIGMPGMMIENLRVDVERTNRRIESDE